MAINKPTVNQINSFCERNLILSHYLAWRENVNRRDRRWNEYATGNLEKRQIQRVTLRGNAIYGNLLISIGAFMGVRDLNNYNYKRDHFYFDLSVRYTVSLDVDGVWIKAELPWSFTNEYGFQQKAYLSQRLRANVPFCREALKKVVSQVDAKLFFPENSVLGKIQRQYHTDKKEAMVFLTELLKRKKEEFIPLSSEDRYDDSRQQRAISRRLKNCILYTSTTLSRTYITTSTSSAIEIDFSNHLTPYLMGNGSVTKNNPIHSTPFMYYLVVPFLGSYSSFIS